jgi:hypothetical protein
MQKRKKVMNFHPSPRKQFQTSMCRVRWCVAGAISIYGETCSDSEIATAGSSPLIVHNLVLLLILQALDNVFFLFFAS